MPEDIPYDLVPPPPPHVQMSATQTLHTISHDQVAVVPLIVTSVTILEDLRSHMRRLN